MILDLPPYASRLSLWLGQQLMLLQAGGGVPAVSAALAALTGVVSGNNTMPGDATGPTCWVFWSGQYTVVFVNCTETNVQAAGLMSGYLLASTAVNNYGRNQYMYNRAAAISAFVQANVPNTTPVITIAGHSQGGAIAPILGFLLKSTRRYGGVRVVSYGAPRVAFELVVNVYEKAIQIARHMNVEDPVPLFPPRDPELCGPWCNWDGIRMRRVCQFCHPDFGYQITTTGAWLEAVTPSGASIPQLANFTGWLLNLNQAAVNAHRMSEYVRRMQLYVSNLTPAAAVFSPVLPRTPQAPEPVVTVQEIRVAIRDTTQNIFRAATAQQVANLIIPPPQQFSVQRARNIWSVYFAGQLVAIGPTKRRALNLKNLGNNFLRRMMRSAYVDAPTMIAQFTQFMTLSSTPGNGFAPLLQVNLPNN